MGSWTKPGRPSCANGLLPPSPLSSRFETCRRMIKLEGWLMMLSSVKGGVGLRGEERCV